jgi:hypothetical protein
VGVAVGDAVVVCVGEGGVSKMGRGMQGWGEAGLTRRTGVHRWWAWGQEGRQGVSADPPALAPGRVSRGKGRHTGRSGGAAQVLPRGRQGQQHRKGWEQQRQLGGRSSDGSRSGRLRSAPSVTRPPS